MIVMRRVKIKTISAWDQKSYMPFLSNDVLKFVSF